jgi:hypothetical protein
MVMSMFFKLCSLAPKISILLSPFMSADFIIVTNRKSSDLLRQEAGFPNVKCTYLRNVCESSLFF